MSRIPSRTATRVAFVVIVVFLLAQVVWWIVFQGRYLADVTTERLASWERDAATLTELYAQVEDQPGLAERVLAEYPHLELAGGRFVVAQGVRSGFLAQQRSYRRMVAFEGPFFVLVILSLLGFIGISLRAERDLKRRQHNFLSAITHEFNTPISTLRLLVQTALMRDLTRDKQHEYLQRMEGELDRLERTSEQVLASARLEQSEEPPDLRAADLGDEVKRIVQRSQSGLEARGARLEVRRPPGPLPVRLDPDAFALVLGNVLDNAVKYTPGDRKPVTVTVDPRGDVIAVHVDDEGVGIPDNERKHVFERFYRRGDEMTRESIGMGLGLHLVRTTVEAMNGWVRIDDNPAGRGTRVSVVLPRRVGTERGTPGSAGASAEDLRTSRTTEAP